MTALAVEAFAPSIKSFNCGRAFAALARPCTAPVSSGGKERLGRTSKAGQADPPIADYRCNVANKLDGPQIHSRGLVASEFHRASHGCSWRSP